MFVPVKAKVQFKSELHITIAWCPRCLIQTDQCVISVLCYHPLVFLLACVASVPLRAKSEFWSRRAWANRGLKIPGRELLGRLPEVTSHNRACARELSTHLPTVLVSSRTSFHPICCRIENVSILRLFWSDKCFNPRRYFQLYWRECL